MPNVIAGAIGLLLFNIGLNIAIVNAVTLVIVPAIIRLGVGLALSAAASALTQRRTPSVKPSNGQQEIRQEVPVRRKCYGRVRVSGPIWWSETDTNNPDDAYIGVLVNHGRISEFHEFFLDDDAVTTDASGALLTPTKYIGDDETVSIIPRYGNATETEYAEILSAFTVPDCRGDGIASVLCRYNNFEDAETQIEVYPRGVPRFRATISGSVVYDPRDDNQDPDDETTWKASENPIVCLYTYMFLDPDGYGIDSSRGTGNLAEWKYAMDLCDVAIAKAATGWEKRYRVALINTLDRDPKDVVIDFLAACDGRTWPRADGTIGVSVGVFEEPTVTIGPQHILAVTDLQFGRDPIDTIGGVRAQYMSPDHDYLEQEMDPWPTGAVIESVFESRVAQLDLQMVPSHTQARRLAKREYVRNQGGWHGTLVCNLGALRARDERFINVVIPYLGIDASFELEDYAEDMNQGQVTLEINQVGSEIDDWDPEEEEGTPPAEAPGFAEQQVGQATGTPIGNMTGNGGLAAAFDGDTTENASNSAEGQAASGYYIGKTYSPGKRISRCLIWPSTDSAWAFGGATQITLALYGKAGTAPSTATDGTLLGSITVNNTTIGVREILSTDKVTTYDHAWVAVTANGGTRTYMAEMIVYEQI